MCKIFVVRIQQVSLLIGFIFSTTCGAGIGHTIKEDRPVSQISIAGGGIKGPLAFATVKLYPLDRQIPKLYNVNKRIDVAKTNAYAEITGLNIPANIPPPYVMVVHGKSAIDLNTGVAPVIQNLVTIVTQKTLNSGQTVYATPYTTLAYYMLKNRKSGSIEAVLADLNRKLIQSVGFGIPAGINIFTTPPVITAKTTTIAQQKLVVSYRAAIETLSSLLQKMHVSQGISTDKLLQTLAYDIRDNGVIDGTIFNPEKGFMDTSILSLDPMRLDIANTRYLVRDITSLMAEEMATVGDSANTNFFKDNIDVSLKPLGQSNNANVIVPDNTASNNTVQPSGDAVSNNSNTVAANSATNVSISSAKGSVLNVDFNKHAGGPYTRQNAINDFNADQSVGTGKGIGVGDLDIVKDPLGTRGKVLRMTHYANKAGGDARFKAKLPSADDYYLAYDLFVPANYEFVLLQKIPGLMYGSMLEASHLTNQKPVPEGVKAFSARHQIIEAGIYTKKGAVNQLTTYVYDADRVQYNRWFSTRNPSGDGNDKTAWGFPRGRWVTIEQRVKQNTATSENGIGDKNNGILQAWVDGKLAIDKRNMHWRTKNSMHIDGIFMHFIYGGGAGNPKNWPRQTQYSYFDNFRVSTSPITH